MPVPVTAKPRRIVTPVPNVRVEPAFTIIEEVIENDGKGDAPKIVRLRFVATFNELITGVAPLIVIVPECCTAPQLAWVLEVIESPAPPHCSTSPP